MDYGKFYTQEYYNQYRDSRGSVSYRDNEFVAFFNHVANKIVEFLHPHTVLDVGCAMGYLVTALRDRGVEAYGIDISEYAIGQIREDIRPYCHVQSALDDLPDNFPKHFDLLTTIEMIEHLVEPDGLQVIEKFCSYSDQILFSSTPDDKEEPTHFNVQNPEYWAKHFAQQNFLHDLNLDFSFLSKQAMYFKKTNCSQAELVEEYEKSRYQLAESLRKNIEACALQQEQVQDLQGQLQDYQANSYIRTAIQHSDIQDLKQQVSSSQVRLNQEIESNHALRGELECAWHCYHSVVASPWWKLTAPGRFVVTKAKNVVRKILVRSKLQAILQMLKKYGVQGIRKKAKYRKELRRIIAPNSVSISRFITAESALKQIQEKFDPAVKFSILVPLYNTQELFLREMIDSCINQTYQNWELCLADASDQQHEDVKKICEEYAVRDKRIRYQKLADNAGISKNTNAAIDMATGDYICLLDHDDILHPSALFENMYAISTRHADFIYTDELTFEGDNLDAVAVVHLKPDFAIDNLRSNNYICHFSTFSRELLEKAGHFNPECDGSQDYDLVLRLTEKAKSIVHIPKVLYYWRSHAGSVASDVSVKPYCITAAQEALTRHLSRVGLKGIVAPIPQTPSFYRIQYKLNDNPKISIIIPTKDHINDLDKCLDSILTKTTYTNYEIILVENNSTQPITFSYYDSLKKYPQIHIIKWKSEFNYSAINNFAVQNTSGTYFVFLNNDVEILTSDWLEQMLMFAQRNDVGAVGVKLNYPDNTIQHAGLGIGLLTLAGHLHRGFDRLHPGYMGRLLYSQDVSGVTAACMMVKKSVFEEVNGFDPKFAVAFNDVDLCMKIRKLGYLIVFTPYAELYHYESKSRGSDLSPKNFERFELEVKLFQERWKKELLQGDPYLNPNLDTNREDFSFAIKPYKSPID